MKDSKKHISIMEKMKLLQDVTNIRHNQYIIAEEVAYKLITEDSDFKTEGFSDFQNGKLIGIAHGMSYQYERLFDENELCMFAGFYKGRSESGITDMSLILKEFKELLNKK